MCDSHPKVLAVKRIQGETDSFGCEYVCMCQACVDEYKAYQEEREATPRYCESCRSLKLQVRPMRDVDEGQSGRLYDTCGDCRTRIYKAAAAELGESGGHYDYFDDGDYD